MEGVGSQSRSLGLDEKSRMHSNCANIAGKVKYSRENFETVVVLGQDVATDVRFDEESCSFFDRSEIRQAANFPPPICPSR